MIYEQQKHYLLQWKKTYLFFVGLAEKLNRSQVYFSCDSFLSIFSCQSSPPSLTATVEDRYGESEKDDESEEYSPDGNVSLGWNLLNQLFSHVFVTHDSRDLLYRRQDQSKDTEIEAKRQSDQDDDDD